MLLGKSSVLKHNGNVVMVRFFLKLLMVITLLLSGACTHLKTTDQTATVAPNSLFTRIGGLLVLTKIVDKSIDEVAISPRTKRSFDGIKLKPLKESIVAQLCKITGGGCVYEGETMLNSHRDAKISEAEFNAFVDIFRNTLDKHLATREKNELLKILAPMKSDIVTPL